MSAKAALRVGLVGARGYVGRELIALLSRHPTFEIAFVSSQSQAGSPVRDAIAEAPEGLLFEAARPDEVASRGLDAVVLALGNGESAAYVAAIDRASRPTTIVDISADHRVDDAWVYGLPELFRARLSGARRIANPGCYATAAALSVAPIARDLAGPAIAFGVSGYSGAGATPSPRNDEKALRDNVMPYQLVGHLHERELRAHVANTRLLPHVAPFFRGIAMTVSLPLAAPLTLEALRARYEDAYASEPLVRLTEEAPLVASAAGKPWATLGGFAIDASGTLGVVVATLDNLLKGAASQAVQNLNLSFGLPERAGIDPWPS